ncbi:hypothetical protein ACIHDR_38640 [Nocardia sp. NPDC052278]
MRDLVAVPVICRNSACGHNPMLEQPLALVTVLRALLSTWFAGD